MPQGRVRTIFKLTELLLAPERPLHERQKQENDGGDYFERFNDVVSAFEASDTVHVLLVIFGPLVFALHSLNPTVEP